MDHNTFKSRLYEFYDGELAGEEAQIFSKHLSSCRQCQSEIKLWKSASQAFFKKPEVQVLSGFSQRVMNKILQKTEKGRKSQRISILDYLALPQWEMITAFSVAVFIFSYFSVHYLKQERTAANPMAWVYNQAGAEQWLLSRKEIGKEDLVQIALGDSHLDESDLEAQFLE